VVDASEEEWQRVPGLQVRRGDRLALVAQGQLPPDGGGGLLISLEC